jgi:hypothetical protein
MPFRPLWSVPLQAGAAGLSLSREAGSVLAWDRNQWLYLLDGEGRSQARYHFAGRIQASCCADDGSAYAAVGVAGEVVWLTPELRPRWEKTLLQPALTVALDPFGQYLAIADVQGGLHVFDCLGRPVSQAEAPRPLHHLAFVPALPLLVGSADYGLAAAFDLGGILLWRVGLVAHVGGLAVSGDGGLIALACFSEGILRYQASGRQVDRVALPEPCRLVSVSFDGRLLLAGGLAGWLWLLDQSGKELGAHASERAAALALGALGRDAFVAVADGPLFRFALE